MPYKGITLLVIAIFVTAWFAKDEIYNYFKSNDKDEDNK